MKIGIIGAGKISQKHITALQSLGYSDLAIFDINHNLANTTANQYRIKLIDNLSSLLNYADIVVVCTPVKTHKELIIKALENKKHVFCEKPLCETAQEANEIEEAAKQNNKLVMVGYLYRFHPHFQQVKKWLNDNALDNIHFGIFRIGGRGNHKKWKHLKETGGGCINEMLIHKLDLIHYFFDHIDQVKVLNCETILKERLIENELVNADAEDNILLKLTTGNTTLICQADFTTPCYMEYCELHGKRGSVFASILDSLPTQLFLSEPYKEYKQGNNPVLSHQQSNLFEREWDHFMKCIEKGTLDINTVADSLKLINLVEKIRTEEGKIL